MFITIIFLNVGMYVNCVCQVYAQYRSDKIDLSAITLPDIGFDILPYIDPLFADFCCYSMMLLTLVRFFFGVIKSGHRIRRHIFRRHIFCLGALFFLRAFSIICTMLPNPLKTCETDVTRSPFIEAFRVLAGRTVTCADVMYSGHTVNITLCALTWHYYSHLVPLFPDDPRFDPLFSWFGKEYNKMGDLERMTTVKLLIWVYACFGYICIVGSHFHYTLDVFIALLLSMGVYKYHQLLIRTAHQKQTWIYSIFQWSEADAQDMIEYRTKLTKWNEKSLKGGVATADFDSDVEDDDQKLIEEDKSAV